MKNLVLVAVVSFLPLVFGCGAQKQFGNFTQVDSQSLVNDTLTVLLATYPPAQTRLNLFHEVNDTYGSKLVRALRTHGYAISEHSDKPKDKYAETGMRFGFILDEFRPEKEYSLTLFVGDDILSRSYAVRGSDDSKIFVGLGQWTRRR